MSNDFDPLKDYAYGDLNPILPGGQSKYRPGQTTAAGILRNVATKQYEPDSTEGTGPYKAICLRIESAAAGGEAGGGDPSKASWLDRIYAPQGLPVPDMFVEIKAYIPEIHGAMLPTPKSLGANGEPDHAAINKFPTFVAKSRDVLLHGLPKPGDIVWVDFGNRKSLTDPIYLGPLESQLLETMQSIAGTEAFACDRGLNMNAPAGAAITSPAGVEETADPVGKIGPTMPKATLSIRPKKGKIPQGKGMFLGNTDPGLNLAQYAPVSTAKKAGLSWIAIRGALLTRGQKSQKFIITERQKVKEIIEEYHKEGIACYIWGMPALKTVDQYGNAYKQSTAYRGDPEDVFVKEIIKTAVDCGAIGVIVNPEGDTYAEPSEETDYPIKDSKGPSRESIARSTYLANKLSTECKRHRLSLGCAATSITRPDNPIQPWAKVSDFAIPKAYSTTSFWNSQKNWLSAYDNFKGLGFKNIIAGMGANSVKANGKKHTKTANRMRWELHAAYGSLEGYEKIKWSNAIVWWDWDKFNKLDRWSVVTELGNPDAPKSATASEVTTPAAPGDDGASAKESPGTVTVVNTVNGEVTSVEKDKVLLGGVEVPGTTPKTKEKENSAEVVEKSTPKDEKAAGPKRKELMKQAAIGPNGKPRDFKAVPLTDNEIMKLSVPQMTKEKYENLKSLAEKQPPALGMSDKAIKELEAIKEDIIKRIQSLAKASEKSKELNSLEDQLISLKKKKKWHEQQKSAGLPEEPVGDPEKARKDFIATHTKAVAKINEQIKQIEEKIKAASQEIKDNNSIATTPSQTINCPPGTFGPGAGGPGASGAAAGAGVNPYTGAALAPFPKSSFPGATNDSLAIATPIDQFPKRLGKKFKQGVTQVMIHQSGNHTVKGTMKSLFRKKNKKTGEGIPCSVHFTCDLDGKVRQHLPLDTVGIHAKGHNGFSIGVEMITRYLPDWQSYSRPPDQPVVHKAQFNKGWGNRNGKLKFAGDPGRFRLPTQAAMEGCYNLSKWLSTKIPTIPWKILGEEPQGFTWIAANNISPSKFEHGITSHSRSQADRSDGVFTEHYIACRKNGCTPADAFNRTMAAAHMPRNPRGRTVTNIHRPGVPYEKYVPGPENRAWFEGKGKKK